MFQTSRKKNKVGKRQNRRRRQMFKEIFDSSDDFDLHQYVPESNRDLNEIVEFRSFPNSQTENLAMECCESSNEIITIDQQISNELVTSDNEIVRIAQEMPFVDDFPNPDDNFAQVSIQNGFVYDILPENTVNNIQIRRQTSESNLSKGISRWAVNCRIPHSKLKQLLSVMNENDLNMPKDPRTLLGTPRLTNVKALNHGEYKHYGIHSNIEEILSNELSDSQNLVLDYFVDDVPVNKIKSMTVISGSLKAFDSVFLIGAYKAFSYEEELDDINDIMEDFVEEVTWLINNGIYLNEKSYTFELGNCICDAVAKAKLFKTKYHTGYFSCTKCCVDGERRRGRIYFENLSAAKRTDDEEIERSTSVLKTIPGVKLVSKTPLDYMHLICLGVMKRLLLFWFQTPKKNLGRATKTKVSDALKNFSKFCPCDFARKPEKHLKYLSKWKATQYRQFLLYIGMVCLYKVVPNDIYQNFLKLCVATRIFISGATDLYRIAHHKLKKFIKDFGKLYGKEYINHNVHNLIHLKSDVEMHGSLDTFSAFKYENYMQSILQDIRKPSHILQQLGNRSKEAFKFQNLRAKKDFKVRTHVDGPLLPGISGIQYTFYKHDNFIINTKSLGDSCFQVNNKIIIIENIVDTLDQKIIIGREFKKKSDFFDKPLKSSLLNIFQCSELSDLKSYDINSIRSKYFRLPLRTRAFVVCPLLHFE